MVNASERKHAFTRYGPLDIVSKSFENGGDVPASKSGVGVLHDLQVLLVRHKVLLRKVLGPGDPEDGVAKISGNLSEECDARQLRALRMVSGIRPGARRRRRMP